MKSIELMIGDWVSFFGSPKKITLLTATQPLAADPIPLTTEILEKNGWEYYDKDAKFFPGTWGGGGLLLEETYGGFMIAVVSDYDDEDTNQTPFVLKYVHELQHALRLLNKDKEITI